MDLKERVAYGVGDFANNMMFSPVNSFMTYFLTNVAGINLPFVSLAAMITRNQYERGVLNISKMIFAFTGGLFINMATLPMV